MPNLFLDYIFSTIDLTINCVSLSPFYQYSFNYFCFRLWNIYLVTLRNYYPSYTKNFSNFFLCKRELLLFLFYFFFLFSKAAPFLLYLKCNSIRFSQYFKILYTIVPFPIYYVYSRTKVMMILCTYNTYKKAVKNMFALVMFFQKRSFQSNVQTYTKEELSFE